MTTEKKEYPQEVINALDSAISDKWFNITFRGGHDGGNQDCPLCGIFNKPYYRCLGCPIADHANYPECGGATGCDMTPYKGWLDASGPVRKVHDHDSAYAAYQFYRWLQDLRAKVKVKEEKKFKPFTVTINTLEEAQEMWHRTNPESMRDPYDPDKHVKYSGMPYPEHSVHRIWRQLSKALGRN